MKRCSNQVLNHSNSGQPINLFIVSGANHDNQPNRNQNQNQRSHRRRHHYHERHKSFGDRHCSEQQKHQSSHCQHKYQLKFNKQQDESYADQLVIDKEQRITRGTTKKTNKQPTFISALKTARSRHRYQPRPKLPYLPSMLNQLLVVFGLCSTMILVAPLLSAQNDVQGSLALVTGVLKTFQQAACDTETIHLECPASTIIHVYAVQYSPEPVRELTQGIISTSTAVNNTGIGATTSGPIQRPSLHYCGTQSTASKIATLSNYSSTSSNKSHITTDGGLLVSAQPLRAPSKDLDDDVLCTPSDRQRLKQSLQRKLDSQCRHKNNCSVELTPDSLAFDGDDQVHHLCPNHRKLAEVAYKCRPEKFINLFACETTSHINLTCPKPDRLIILYARFGALAGETITQCYSAITRKQTQEPALPTTLQEGSCLSRNSTGNAITMCHAQQQCSLKLDSETLGEPNCPPGIIKHAKVVYTCIPDKAFSLAHLQSGLKIASHPLPENKDKSITSSSAEVIAAKNSLLKSQGKDQVNNYNYNNTKQSIQMVSTSKQPQVEVKPLYIANAGSFYEPPNKNKLNPISSNNDVTQGNSIISEHHYTETRNPKQTSSFRDNAQSRIANDATMINRLPILTTSNGTTRDITATAATPSEIDIVQISSMSDSSTDMQMDGGVLNHYIAAARSIEQASMKNLSANLIGMTNFNGQQIGQSSASSSVNVIDVIQVPEVSSSSSEPPPKFMVVDDAILIDGKYRYKPSEARKHHNIFTWFADKWYEFFESIKRDYAKMERSVSSDRNNGNNMKNDSTLHDLYKFLLVVMRLHGGMLCGVIAVVIAGLLIFAIIYRTSSKKRAASQSCSTRSTSASESISLDSHPMKDLKSSKKKSGLVKHLARKTSGETRWFQWGQRNDNKKGNVAAGKPRPLSLVDNSSDNSNSLSREYCDQTDDDGFDTSSHNCQGYRARGKQCQQKQFYSSHFNSGPMMRPSIDTDDYFMAAPDNNTCYNIINNEDIDDNGNFIICNNSNGINSHNNNNNGSTHDTNSLATSMTVTSGSTYTTPIPQFAGSATIHHGHHQLPASSNHTITFCSHHPQQQQQIQPPPSHHQMVQTAALYPNTSILLGNNQPGQLDTGHFHVLSHGQHQHHHLQHLQHHHEHLPGHHNNTITINSNGNGNTMKRTISNTEFSAGPATLLLPVSHEYR